VAVVCPDPTVDRDVAREISLGTQLGPFMEHDCLFHDLPIEAVTIGEIGLDDAGLGLGKESDGSTSNAHAETVADAGCSVQKASDLLARPDVVGQSRCHLDRGAF
jgi:hypothetical protein